MGRERRKWKGAFNGHYKSKFDARLKDETANLDIKLSRWMKIKIIDFETNKFVPLSNQHT